MVSGFLRRAFSNGIPLRAFLVALVVGPILTVINQYGALFEPATFHWGKFALTMLVPYCVATWGGIGAQKECELVRVRAHREAQAQIAAAREEEPDTARATELRELAGRVRDIAENVNAASRERLEFVQEVLENTRTSAEESEAMRQTAHDSCERLRQASADAQAVRDRIDQIANDMDHGATMCREVGDAIESFRERFGNIDQMARQIREIADQTNLLALNARIEAARAGQSGRGFAVVAEEVNRLAESAGETADQINGLVEELTGSVEGITEKVQDLAGRMDHLSQESHEGNQQVDAISEAINRATDAADDAAQRATSQAEEFARVVDRLEQVESDTRQAIEGSSNNYRIGCRLVELTGTDDGGERS